MPPFQPIMPSPQGPIPYGKQPPVPTNPLTSAMMPPPIAPGGGGPALGGGDQIDPQILQQLLLALLQAQGQGQLGEPGMGGPPPGGPPPPQMGGAPPMGGGGPGGIPPELLQLLQQIGPPSHDQLQRVPFPGPSNPPIR